MQLLNEWQDGGMPLFPLLKHNNLYEVMSDMFDERVTYDPNNSSIAYPDLMLKSFPFKVDHKLLNGCCQVEWYEDFVDEVLATTSKVVISGTVINYVDVADARQWRWPSEWSEMYFVNQVTGVTTIRVITWINPTGFTIDSAVNVPAWTVISRWPKYRVIGNCEGGMDDFFTQTEKSIRTSNFASIVYSVKFNRCDLNKDRLMYNYGYDENDRVKNELVQPAQGFRNLFTKSFLYGNNTYGSSTYGSVTVGSQTMGLISDISKAQACVNPTNDPMGKRFVHDFTDCCANADNDCDIMEIFQDKVIEPILASGAYGDGEPMTVWMNQAQIKEFRKFSPAIQDIFWPQVINIRNVSDNNNDIFYNKFQLESFQIGMTRFEYKFSKILNEQFKTIPVMIIFPKKFVAFYQYAVDGMDESFKVKMNQDRSPRLEFIDASPLAHMKSGSRDCYYYRMNLTYSLLLANLCSGAYAMVVGLKTKSSCLPAACGGTFNPVSTIVPVLCPTQLHCNIPNSGCCGK